MNDSCNVNLETNKNNQNEKIIEKNEENKNVNSNEKLAPKLSRKNLIKGPYILGEVIGEGNFGTVRLATQIKIGEKLAIKIINKNNIKKKSDIVRIKKEISILKKIRHKNIIQIYEVMESNQNVYIAMENCEGKELFEYIIKNKRLKELEACRLFRQLINGVDYIHSQGIIHRDLKPENILLDENMDIKISDFGLSTFFSKGEYLSTPCGTPNYAPPEMLIGQKYDGELSDIWSCGIILYTMLTGSLPCAESKETIILNKIVSNQYIIPNYLSKGAIDLLSCMLEPDYLKRIKIKDIMKHPWFNKTKNQLTPGIDIKNNEHTPIDESILKKMLQYGYNINECRDNLEHMKNNSLTTVYYLLLKKFIHNKGQSIADLKSPAFLEYMAKNSGSEGTNNYIQNTIKMVSEDNSKKKNFENILLNEGLNKSCFSNNILGKSKNFEMNAKLAKHAKKKSEDISNLSLQLKKFNFNKDISLSKSKNKNKTKANLNNNTFNSHYNCYEDNNFLTQNQFLYSNNLKANNKINSGVNSIKDKKIFYQKKKTPDIKKIKILSSKNNQNKKSNKKIGVNTKLSSNNVKKLKSPTLTKKIKNNFIDNNIYSNQTSNKTNNSNFHSINLTESMTIPNNALNLLSSSINITNTNNEKDKNKNKLKSISPKQKLIIKNKEEISKNENNKKDYKENKKEDEQNNNISVIKMIANKIINYTINNSFDAPESIKNKKNYASVIQRDDPQKTHDLYFSQQAYQEHQDNNIRKKITTERIFTETKKKKSQNDNVVLDKSDSPVNYSIEKIISSNRVAKKNIKQKNISSKNNVVKTNNNKSNNKNYNNRYESTKNIENKNLKISERNSVSPKKKENKELTHNLNLNNANNKNESVIFEDEKSEVESKDSKKVNNYINGNKLIIQIANTDINGAKNDSKSKIKTENKQINKSHFNNGNYSSKNVVNTSIKDFKLLNNDKNNIYINKFSKRYISPISQNRGTFKKQNIEKNINIKKSFKSKDKIKDKEKEKDYFMDNNKKYETYTNRAGKLKGNKISNGNFTNSNINSNNNKNKEISNSKKNIYLTKTYNTNLNQNTNTNKKNNNDNNNSNTLSKKKNFNKICHTRTGSGSDSVSFFSKIKVISSKINNRRRQQKDQIPEESGLHIKHLTSGNILTEYKNKTYNKSFNNNSKENNFYLDSIVKNYSITGLIDKISNFLKKEKYNITKQISPNLHSLKCSKEGGLIFHIEIIPLTSKNNDIFYLKKIFDKGDVKIFNELISNLQKNL